MGGLHHATTVLEGHLSRDWKVGRHAALLRGAFLEQGLQILWRKTLVRIFVCHLQSSPYSSPHYGTSTELYGEVRSHGRGFSTMNKIDLTKAKPGD